MSIYHFLNLLFYVEILVLIITAFFIITKRLINFLGPHKTLKSKKYLAKVISLAYSQNKSCVFNQKFKKNDLLEVLEDFSHRFSGDDWESLKLEIAKKHLLEGARNKVTSLFWIKRVFASRVFVLCGLKDDRSSIIKLFEDSNYLVSSIAARALIKIEDEKGIEKILKRLSLQQGYYHYLYLDLLSKGSIHVLTIIDKIAQRKDALHLVCLEVLGLQNQILDFGYLEQDLKSNNQKIVIAALKIAIRDPSDKWESLVLNLENSPNITVRLLAIKALANYPSKKSISALKEACKSDLIEIQTQAAFSLKSLDLIADIKDETIKAYVVNFES